jgi:membrane-bound ClpP family serine protease
MDKIQNEGSVHNQSIESVEALTKRNLVVYESFFSHPAGIIDDPDDNWIERLLTSIDLTKHKGTLDLLINSPGGNPTTAEKIILTCRSYADSFRVIVPSSAMSAATLIAMGSDAIVMTPTAEIGPIDPQMRMQTPQGPSSPLKKARFHAAHLAHGGDDRRAALAATSAQRRQTRRKYPQNASQSGQTAPGEASPSV